MNRRKRSKSKSGQTQKEPNRTARSKVWPAYLSAVLLWASFPPIGLHALAWIAPWGWIWFSDRPKLGRRDYLHLWFSGCIFWLAILQGIRLAYWPLYFGWLALSLYLAIYTPLFVFVLRKLRSGWIPPLLAPAIAWVAMEFTRSYVITGYCANGLAYSQVQLPAMIQIADQLGAYGISFVMMLVSAATYQLLLYYRVPKRLGLANEEVTDEASSPNSVFANRVPSGRSVVFGLVTAVAFVVLNVGYGLWKLREADQLAESREPLVRALLVQENTPTMFDATLQDLRDAWERYLQATHMFSEKYGKPDVVVWPESTFTAGVPWYSPKLPQSLPKEYDGLDRQYLVTRIEELGSEFTFKSRRILAATNAESLAGEETFLLVGSDSVEVESAGDRRFNSAMWIGPDGQLVDRYDKMHLVMFGEYIPLGPLLQPLRDAFGLKTAPGRDPKCFEVEGAKLAPNICFESMMPRVIRSQISQLAKAGESPDVLVNVSNDSWFRGSSMLDHHLACTILCAVENRRPILVAANTGLSAEIDGAGRVLQITEKFAVDGIWALPKRDSRGGLVQWFGYPLAWVCLALSILVFLPQLRRR